MTLAQRMSLLGTETAFEVFAKAKEAGAMSVAVIISAGRITVSGSTIP